MPDPPPRTIFIVVEDRNFSTVDRKLSALAGELPSIQLERLPSLNVAIERLQVPNAPSVPAVVVDFAAASDGQGGGDTTISNGQRIKHIKCLPGDETPLRKVIGVSPSGLFSNNLKGYGCDEVCDPDLVDHYIRSLLGSGGNA